MVVAFKLAFTLIACDRCGSKERVAGNPCSDCGNRGRVDEVNSAVVRRRQGVRAVREMTAGLSLAESEVLPYYLSRSSWRALMADALETVLTAFAEFVREPLETKSQRSVAVSIAELRRIERDLVTFPPRRPFISDLKANMKAAECLTRMAGFYLDAFEAATPGAAQSLGQHAQSEIDKAAELHDQAERQRDLGVQLSLGDPQNLMLDALGAC